MSPELQQLLVAACVVGALAYLAWRRSRPGEGCGGCPAAAGPEARSPEQPLHEGLIQLEALPDGRVQPGRSEKRRVT